MKRLLFIIAMALCVASVNAQGLFMDKTEDNGQRSVVTGAMNIYRNFSNGAALQLAYVKSSTDDEQYLIRLTFNEFKMQIDEGRKLLIKFSDDSIMELRNATKIGPADYDYSVSHGITDYFVSPSYLVTEEQLEEMASKNVVKIRVETNTGSFDREIKKNKFSKAVDATYNTMKRALSVERNVYTGF